MHLGTDEKYYSVCPRAVYSTFGEEIVRTTLVLLFYCELRTPLIACLSPWKQLAGYRSVYTHRTTELNCAGPVQLAGPSSDWFDTVRPRSHNVL